MRHFVVFAILMLSLLLFAPLASAESSENCVPPDRTMNCKEGYTRCNYVNEWGVDSTSCCKTTEGCSAVTNPSGTPSTPICSPYAGNHPQGGAYSADGFHAATRTVNICIRGFNTVEELKKTKVQFSCTNNSNMAQVGLGLCQASDKTASLENLPYETDRATGKYYTCVAAVGVDRAVGKMDVTFTNAQTGSQYCKQGVYTKPADWNIATEQFGIGKSLADTVCGNSITCRNCLNNDDGVWTAIGCIPKTPQKLFARLFGFGMGIAGGIAFLLILFGGFQVMTSSGNPEQLNEGKELVVGAITGLIMVICSVFLLKIVGIDILGIPWLT